MYQEGKDSTFTHNGKTWPLDPFLKRAAKLPVRQIPLDRLKWNLQYGTADPDRVAKADLSVPILFTVDPKWGYTVVDGFHRLTKAFADPHRRSIPGREIPQAWFKEIGQVSMESLGEGCTVGQVTREQAFAWLSEWGQSRPEFLLQPGESSPDRIYAFAWRGDEVVGYASLLNNQRYLIDMYVPESLRGQGIGRTLVDSLRVDLVVVRKHQEDIIAFLDATGFRLEQDCVSTRIYRKYHGAMSL